MNQKCDEDSSSGGTYPQFLSLEQFDETFLQKNNTRVHTFCDQNESVKFLKSHNWDWQIYTQIDGEDARGYIRGFNLWDQTGVWKIVKDNRFEVMEYVRA